MRMSAVLAEGNQKLQAGAGMNMPEMRRNAGECPMLAYMPVPLRSMNEICKYMRVGEGTVRDWIRNGAPIAVEYMGSRTRYSCELMRLQNWRERNAVTIRAKRTG